MRIGSLFAGIGGLDLACEWSLPGARTAWQLDTANAAIRRRHWPDALQVEADVQTVDPLALLAVDVLCAGFPCQDLSVAGKQAGLDGERSGLYREVLRFTQAIGPRFVVLENVSGLLRYMPRLSEDFRGLGYGLSYTLCEAADAGHPHLRQRVFVLAERGAAGRGLVEAQVRPWATVTAANPNEGEDPVSWHARAARLTVKHNNSNGAAEPLAQQIRAWNTVVSTDAKGSGPRQNTATLGRDVYRIAPDVPGKRLNPAWTEALMGYPPGWTEPTGPRLECSRNAPAVRGRYPATWDRSVPWPGYAWEPSRTIPDGPAVPGRPARVKAVGNAVCPQQAALALDALLDRDGRQGRLW